MSAATSNFCLGSEVCSCFIVVPALCSRKFRSHFTIPRKRTKFRITFVHNSVCGHFSCPNPEEFSLCQLCRVPQCLVPFSATAFSCQTPKKFYTETLSILHHINSKFMPNSAIHCNVVKTPRIFYVGRRMEEVSE